MKRIAYLLHRFPGITDTFIKREIRCLQKLGTDVRVVSIWRPGANETTPAILKEWTADTRFVLPRHALAIAFIIFASLFRSPARFLRAAHLALRTARPGCRGLAYQLFYFVEAVLVADILRKNAIDHVHNHIGDQSGTVTMLAAKLAGIGYSITFHGWPVFFDAKNWRVKEKVLGAKFTRSISYFCRSQLMMLAGCNDVADFKVVHCGVAVEKYRYRQPREQIKNLFCCARLAPEKGISFLIQALKILHGKGYVLELRLAGDGPSKEQLQTLANDLQIAKHVTFLGFVDENALMNELELADLFVLPSSVEGVPVSVMEAMAVGVPVIATNVAGTSELVETSKSGLLVRPSDSQAIADAVVAMIENYGFRLEAARLGRKKVMDEFDVDQETEKLNRYLIENCI